MNRVDCIVNVTFAWIVASFGFYALLMLSQLLHSSGAPWWPVWAHIALLVCQLGCGAVAIGYWAISAWRLNHAR